MIKIIFTCLLSFILFNTSFVFAGNLKKIEAKSDILEGLLAKIKKEFPPETLEDLKRTQKKDLISTHFGMGLEIRNKYLYGDKNKAVIEYFQKEKKIRHPDEMSGYIIEELWKDLNKGR